jgi:crotonobetainyl-CoA:carnitine CoA-transferase CaiB-like acyl-CoA transferase
VKPLAGLRILDLTRVLAGPYCTQLLAQLGADVIKIEPPMGDETREWGPPFRGGVSAYYLSVNRHKETRRADLHEKTDEIRELAKTSDVFIENYRVGGLTKFGLDYNSIKSINPEIVYCSITGFGQTGPRASEPGYDAIAQGYCGIMSVTGEPDGPPMKVGVAWVDILTGLHAAVGILAAVRAGKGAHLDLSLFECGLAAMSNLAQSALVTGEAPGRKGNAHSQIVPYGSFPASDGWIVIACGNDGQFGRLAEALGRPEWPDDPRFLTNPKRVRNRLDLGAEIASITQTKPRSHWLEVIALANVPVGPVNDLQEAFADPQAIARNLIEKAHHPEAGEFETVACPIRFMPS